MSRVVRATSVNPAFFVFHKFSLAMRVGALYAANTREASRPLPSLQPHLTTQGKAMQLENSMQDKQRTFRVYWQSLYNPYSRFAYPQQPPFLTLEEAEKKVAEHNTTEYLRSWIVDSRGNQV
jgi:hypothetical protein